MNTLEIAQKLISIPSFVDNKTNEREAGEWLFEYLKQFSWLETKKQQVGNGRFNVIAYDKYPTRVLLCDHIDTVHVATGWKTDPLVGTVKGNKLFGLGATDTKGNIATLLTAIKNVGPTKGLMLFIYVDEEYDFAGAKKFIEKYAEQIKPEIIASADGGNLELGNACRGLVEILFRLRGQAGHAANPKNGNNAIVGALELYKELQYWLKRFSTQELGKSTTNIPWISGGQSKPDSQKIGREGNVIPDFAEFGIEIRNASPNLNAKKVIKKLRTIASKKNLKLEVIRVRHDLGAWITKKSELEKIGRVFGSPNFTPAKGRGYVDLQMLWENFEKVSCFTYGAGEGKTAHKANEYIELKKLMEGERRWTDFIREFCAVQ